MTLKILQHCGKIVKTKSQKVLAANSYVCRTYKEKSGRGLFCHPLPSPLILDRVKVQLIINNFGLPAWINFNSCLKFGSSVLH